VYNLNYAPTTLGVQSWREITCGGTWTKKVEYHCCIIFRFFNQNPVVISFLTHKCYIPRPSHCYWFDHPNCIWWGLQIIKSVIMKLAPSSSLFLPVSFNIQDINKRMVRFQWWIKGNRTILLCIPCILRHLVLVDLLFNSLNVTDCVWQPQAVYNKIWKCLVCSDCTLLCSDWYWAELYRLSCVFWLYTFV
jgi:hypothetical protein